MKKTKDIEFKVKERTLYAAGLTGGPGLKDIKIIHLGDLHETRCASGIAGEIVSAGPDLVLVTGDMLDRHKKRGDRFIEILEALDGKYPVYACLGNHELSVKHRAPDIYDTFMERTAELGCVWLDNETVTVSVRGREVTLCGLTAAKRQLLSKAYVKTHLPEPDSGAPLIVLCHDPRWFDMISDKFSALVLSGHVHGGLIRLPLFGGLLSPDFRPLPKYDYGIFAHKNARMYLTSGFGKSVLGIRLFNPRELALLTIKPQSEEPPLAAFLKTCRKPYLYLLVLFTVLTLMLNIRHIHNGTHNVIICVLCLLLLFRIFAERWFVRLRSGKLRHLYTLFKAGMLASGVVFVILSVFMLSATFTHPPENATAVVLGCRVYGEYPSQMLNGRINAAYRYLSDNPGAMCIASGGQGEGETIPEALAIKQGLIKRGISEDRIFVEDKSTNTVENITFSLALIKENGLNEDIATVTDEFHQLRAQSIAEKNGARSGAAVSHTPWYLFEGYWLREVMGLSRWYLLGF